MKLTFAACAAALLLGCEATRPPKDPNDTYLTRSASKTQEGLSVTASVLDEEEIQTVFGAPLDRVGIQPVWLKIDNLSAYSFLLLLRSIDPDYFSPYEVARRSALVSEKSAAELYPRIRNLEIERFVTPGAQFEGYVYTHLDEGLKAINVDFIGNERMVSMNVAVKVPGLTTDFDDFDYQAFDDETDSWLDERDLRGWLSSMPCCTSAKEGALGDPVNIVLVGRLENVRAALVSQRWDVTAEINSSSIRRIVSAFVFGSRYRYAPVSPLYLFGREQDMSFQKARAVIDERNHIRLWLAPITYEGVPVWVGQISRDAGIKLSGRTWPPTTHVIDPAVDEARFYLEQDLLYSRRVQKIGLVEGVGPALADRPRSNAEGDPYFTDGKRAVFFIGNRSVRLDQLEVLDWSLPPELEPFRDSIFETSSAED